MAFEIKRRRTYDHWQDRFFANVDMSGECWLWTGHLDAYGYGSFHHARKGSTRRAHRISYELAYGDPGETLDHLCRVKSCVNPDHLEPVTLAENTRRARAVKRQEVLV